VEGPAVGARPLRQSSGLPPPHCFATGRKRLALAPTPFYLAAALAPAATDKSHLKRVPVGE